MSLHITTRGQGQNLVLIHGWGMNSEVWHSIVPELGKDYCVTTIDLPGHGQSREVKSDYSLSHVLALLSEVIPEDSTILGWSLGGLLAQAFALQYPRCVSKLILVASNAQFQQSEKWLCAMKPEVLNGFIENLKQDYKATLQQFLMLQALGAPDAKQTIRELKERLFLHGEPEFAALEGGLLLLKNISMVKKIKQVRCPVLLINGKLDGLVPVMAGKQMSEIFPNVELTIIEKAAHAPFISHSDLFVNRIREFLSKHDESK